MEKSTKNKGITLIALVITIIVLLILAGISISMLSGDNSILKKAAEAREKTENAKNQEEIAFRYMEAELMDVWSGNVATSFAFGTGTESDPFKISNGEELAYFASLVNGGRDFTGEYVEIIKNINLGNKEFIPAGGCVDKGVAYDESNHFIGNSVFFESSKYFNGTLDGNNKIITGINIQNGDKLGVGLIGTLGEKGIIKNVIVHRGNIKGYTCTGGIVGVSKGTIEECINNALVSASFDVGGIIGYITDIAEVKVKSCENYGDVEGNHSARWNYWLCVQ